jgi:signal peptidase II
MLKKPPYTGLLVAIIVFVLDQVSKYGFFALLENHGTYLSVLPFFNLVQVYNPGISFGIGQNLVYSHLFFSLLALFIVGVLLYWLRKETHTLSAIALGLIIGGAIGNIIDRLLIGAVMDFLDFHAYGYHWPAFNLADSTIFVGVVLLVFFSPSSKKKGK